MYINHDINYLKYLREKEIIIFGTGVKGKSIFAKLKNYKIVAFCDNDEKKQNQLLCQIPVISFQRLCEKNHNNLVIIICSNYEYEIRQQLLEGNIHNFISMNQIDFGGGEEYYNEQYFSWQQDMGKFGGRVKARKFQPYIDENMVVVEFGCGGGYLLNHINAREKLGIEINDTARAAAKEIGINCVKNIGDVKDDYADVIISTSVLEHVENPLTVLRVLRSKLKENGKIIFHVPNESCDVEYKKSDINNHLYTWNCMTLGNLFKAAGYFVQSVQTIQEVWPKHYFEIEQEVSPQLFETICEIGGRAYEENRCIIVASK